MPISTKGKPPYKHYAPSLITQGRPRNSIEHKPATHNHKARELTEQGKTTLLDYTSTTEIRAKLLN